MHQICEKTLITVSELRFVRSGCSLT